MGKILPIQSSYHEASTCNYRPGQQRRIFSIQIPPSSGVVDNIEFKRALTMQGYENVNLDFTMAGMNCPTCNSCVPLRIIAPDFQLSANQKHLNRKNRNLAEKTKITYCNPTTEHYNLYKLFYESRIKDRGIEDTPIDQDRFIAATRIRSQMQIIRDPVSDKLLAALYFDDYGDSLYAASQIYDPEASKKLSLGRYGVMKLVEYACRRGDIRHVYIGSWVKDSKAVDYKKDFHPLEAMTDQGWVAFDPAKHTSGPTQLMPQEHALRLP